MKKVYNIRLSLPVIDLYEEFINQNSDFLISHRHNREHFIRLKEDSLNQQFKYFFSIHRFRNGKMTALFFPDNRNVLEKKMTELITSEEIKATFEFWLGEIKFLVNQ